MELSIYDYIVFAIMLAISSGIGIYYRVTGGKQKTVEEYMLADGKMSPLPVAFSLMASFMSAITLLGLSSENYMHGTQFMLINISYVLATPIIANVYLPVFYKLKAASVYEYLQQRFGPTIRTLASVTFSLQMVLYMGIVLYAPSLAISAVTGLNTVASILVIGSVCTFYSTIGGMKAVLITDVFQSMLMFIAIYCVIIKGAIDLGGISSILKIANEGQRIEFFNFDLDLTTRHTLFSQIIGGGFMFLSIYSVNQTQVQRLLTVRTLKSSQCSLWIALPILIIINLSTALAGLTVYAKYHKCDPLLQGRICSPDQLLPLFVADNFQHLPGLTGLFISGLLSGSLSTISSALNSLAAVTWQDYFKPFLKTTPSQFVATLANKALALIYGLACVGLAFVAANFKGVLQASLTIFGVVGGPLLGIFTLAMVFPFVSEIAVVPSFLIATAIGLWIGFGGPKPPLHRLSGEITACDEFPMSESSCSITASPTNVTFFKEEREYFYLYRISYMWYTLIGFSITIVLSCLLSLRYPQKQRVPKFLLSPIIHRLMSYMYDDFDSPIIIHQQRIVDNNTTRHENSSSPSLSLDGRNRGFSKIVGNTATNIPATKNAIYSHRTRI